MAAAASREGSSRPRLLKIGELARRTGLSRQAVHLYVQLGLIQPAEQTPTGQRLFPEHVVDRITLIRKLSLANEYTLEEIRDIFIKGR